MLERLKDKSILVIGDFVVDHYRHLDPIKVSPEAPVLVFSDEMHEFRPGASGNVAANIAALGAKKVFLLGVVGSDYDDSIIDFKSKAVEPMLVFDKTRPTTVKERLVNRRHQIARIDTKKNGYVSADIMGEMNQRALNKLRDVDAVVFSDYQHGALPFFLCRAVISTASPNAPIIVDTKSPETDKYSGAEIVLPNNVEARMIANNGDDAVNDRELAEMLISQMIVKAVGMTLGAKGILLSNAHVNKSKVFPALDVGERAIDATGAGDAVTAAVASCLACGIGMDDAMVIANIMAGISVTKWGTSIVGSEELESVIETEFDRMKKEAKDA